MDGSDGSHVLGFLAGLRSRWSESSMRHAASDLRLLFRWRSGGMTWRTRSAWPAYAGPARDRGNVARRRAPPLAGGVRLAVGAVEVSAAITLLSLTCGLRACDAIGLRRSPTWIGIP